MVIGKDELPGMGAFFIEVIMMQEKCSCGETRTFKQYGRDTTALHCIGCKKRLGVEERKTRVFGMDGSRVIDALVRGR